MLSAGSPSAAGSRAELVDEFLDLQPRMRRLMTRVIPADIHAEMGAITMQQMHALHTIAQRGAVTMGELAGCLDAASLSSATQMSDRLVKLGLVERMSDPDDRRLVRVALSPRGQELVTRRETAWREGVGRLLQGLTDEECATLVGLLKRAIGRPPGEETSGWVSAPKA
ncbi:MAG: MarR family transcriptional regulator [Candidatus Dormibacteria bacterium]|jgi:DNA-binding MarR family transcriptional regulator